MKNKLILKTSIFIFFFILIQLILANSQNEAFIQANLMKLFIIVDLVTSVLVVSILFFIVYKKEIFKINILDSKISESVLFGILCVATFLVYLWFNSFIVKNFEFVVNYELLFVLLRYLFLFFVLFFLVLAVFGKRFVRQFLNKELLFFVISVWGVYLFLRLAHKLWFFLSHITTKLVYFLLNLTFDAKIDFSGANPVVGIDLFKIGIARPCSGIASLSLFAFLYLFAVFYDWKLFNKKKVILMFFVGLLSVFALNILRVYLLILVGAYISKDFALGVFHTGIAGVLFVAYFALFFWLSYNWMKK